MPFLKGRLCGTPQSLELHWLAACIAERRGDRVAAAKAARVVLNHRPRDNAPWNLFARATAQARPGRRRAHCPALAALLRRAAEHRPPIISAILPT